MYPHLIIEQAKFHQSELLAEADRRHLLRLAREGRRAAKAAAAERKSLRVADEVARVAPVAAAPVSVLASTLTTCGQHVAGSAR